jgi:hypothetical protein
MEEDMKRRIGTRTLLFTVVAAMLLNACNLTPTEAPADDQAVVETMVAETVEAMALQDTATAAAQGQQASDTPQPSATIDQALLTPTETATATVTETATVTLTSTVPPDDPKKQLGEPDFHDRFDAASHWTLYDSSTTKTEIKNGHFYFTMYDTLNYSEWTVTWLEIKDFYLEVTAKATTCSGKDRYGLLFRAPDPSQGYIYTLSCAGSYRLSTWDGTNFKDLVKWSSSDHIHSGSNQSNRIGVWMKGSKIRLYANGYFLAEVMNDKYSGLSRFGMTIASANTPDFEVVFDDMMYWELE